MRVLLISTDQDSARTAFGYVAAILERPAFRWSDRKRSLAERLPGRIYPLAVFLGNKTPEFF